jgi:hypothetical protein
VAQRSGWRRTEDNRRKEVAERRGVAGRQRLPVGKRVARTDARWVEENVWFEERRENFISKKKGERIHGARTNASYKLQNAMQLLLEALRYFKDAHSHEDTAGEGRCYASL